MFNTKYNQFAFNVIDVEAFLESMASTSFSDQASRF